jgi:hypothetical protein
MSLERELRVRDQVCACLRGLGNRVARMHLLPSSVLLLVMLNLHARNMPAPSLHLPLAFETLRAVPALTDADLPAFLWGGVAPDVAQLYGRPRSETHYWPLGDVSGVLRLLAAHPHLAAAALLPSERAFVAGYLAHLVADEQWTFCLWRPYFGLHTPYGGGPEGSALQNAYRDSLDETEWTANPGTRALGAYLEAATGVELRPDLLPFVEVHDLHRAREAIAELCTMPPGRARRSHVGRLVGIEQTERDPEEAKRHDHVIAYVKRSSFDDFRRRSLQEGTRVVAEYLAGRTPEPPLGTQPLPAI